MSDSDEARQDKPISVSADGMNLRCDPFENRQQDNFFFADPALMQRMDLLQHLTQFSDLLPVVIGPAGCGKTAFLHELRRQTGENWHIAVLPGADITDASSLLQVLAKAFGLAVDSDDDATIERLIKHWQGMQRTGQYAVLLLDDAQDLATEAVDKVLHLGGSLQETLKLIRLVFFSEPGIIESMKAGVFQDPREAVLLHPLELTPFSEEQTAAYLSFRLAVAGYSGESPFTPTEVRAIHKKSTGLPARINELAAERLQDRGGVTTITRAAEQKSESVADTDIETETEVEVGQEPEPAAPAPASGRRPWLLGLVAIAAVVILWFQDDINRWFVGPASAPEDHITLELPELPRPVPFELPGDGEVAVPEPAMDTETGPAATRPPAMENAAVADVPPPPPINIPTTPEAVTQEVPPTPVPSVEAPAVPTVQESEPTPVAPPPIADVPPAPQPVPVLASDKAKAQSSGQQWAVPGPRTVEPPPSRPTESAAEPTANVPVPNPGLSGPYREDWLLARNPEQFTVQLLAVSQESSVQSFIQKHGLAEQVAYYPKRRNGQRLYSLVYGVYPSRSAALAAVSAMPDAVRPKQPWVRTLASVQDEIRAYTGAAR